MRKVLLPSLVVLFAVVMLYALEITIDAERDEFYDTLTGPEDGWIYIPYTANNDNQDGAHHKHDDEYDLSANFWCAWDEEYFYFYEEVWDEFVTGDDATTWGNDCLELKFDPAPYMGDTSGNMVFYIGLTALDSADQDQDKLGGVDNLYPHGNSEITGFQYTPDVDYARKLTDFGYNVEGRFLWDQIYCDNTTDDPRGPVYAAVGEIFGMAVMNHDNDGDGLGHGADGTGRYGSIEWASALSDGVWQYVNMHGTVTFLEGNKLELSTLNSITGIDTNTVDYTPVGTKVAASPAQAPVAFELTQNFPNPFNPTTTIEFTLPKSAQVTLKVYDVLGKEVAELVNEVKSAGNHSVMFDAVELPSGIYIYRLDNGTRILSKKMMLVK